MIETDGLYRFLVADATVNGYVAGRVYRVMLPKTYELPAIVYFKVTIGEEIESLDGENSTESRRFQFSCFARDAKTPTLMARSLRSLLVPKSDGTGITPVVSYDLPDGTHIQSARLHDERDLPYEEGPGGFIHHSLVEIEFVYENPS